MKTFISSLMLLFFASQTLAQEEPGLVSTQRLTLNTALMVAQAAIAECTKRGIQIGVTLVDREGIVQVTLRDTSALADRANSAVGRAPGLIMSPGGLPIQVSGSLVGAVGVSGAPSGITDEACAQAGIDAVIDDLEMAM